jgi:hypothetical protein
MAGEVRRIAIPTLVEAKASSTKDEAIIQSKVETSEGSPNKAFVLTNDNKNAPTKPDKHRPIHEGKRWTKMTERARRS